MMLHYQEYRHPTSKEWLVLLHGAGGSSIVWYKQIRAFSAHFNLLLIDLKGHGKSIGKTLYTPRYSFTDIAVDVLKVLQTLSVPPCHFMGISLGAIVIRKIAELEMSRVKTLLMAGAVVGLNFRSQFLMRVAARVRHLVPYMWIYRIYANILMPRKRHKTSRRLFINEAAKIRQKEFLRWFSLTADLSPLLRFFRTVELPVPTVYIMGEEDYMFLPQVKALLKVQHRYSSLIIVPDAGHICNIDNAAFFNRVTLETLEALTVPPASDEGGR
ncbi:MAG: alpha/beta hydrolase [Prevotellaceae bacterium]|jgi:pimeloyl-ACP methyl ester carboxylesterase|nr:alpha/beta hydrolase [Prevotellaceae bacterium]